MEDKKRTFAISLSEEQIDLISLEISARRIFKSTDAVTIESFLEEIVTDFLDDYRKFIMEDMASVSSKTH